MCRPTEGRRTSPTGDPSNERWRLCAQLKSCLLYSQQPSALRAARDTLATAILSVQKKLDGGGQALRDRAQQHRQAEAWLKNATTQIMSECRIQSTNPNTSDWMMFSPNAKKHYRGQW